MFHCLLLPASPAAVKVWRAWSGLATTGTMGTLIAHTAKILPGHFVLAEFNHMAIAIALITGIPLFAFPRVLSVAFAQLGVATSLMYLACGFTPAFGVDYSRVVSVLLVLVAITFAVLFSSGLQAVAQICSKSDRVLGSVMALSFCAMWVVPIVRLWR